MAESETADMVYTRPEGMTDKQEEIIQYAAKYVVASCDSAKYQQRLRAKTKYNPYFGFLDPRHAYHGHYDYLLRSYRYWMEQPGAGPQQPFLSPEEEDVGALAGSGEHGPGAPPYHSGYYSAPGYESSPYDQQQASSSYASGGGNAYSHPSQQQQQQQRGGYVDASGHEADADPTAAPPTSSSPAGGYHAPHQQGGLPHSPDADEEEFELVMQNGVQTLVAKRR